MKIILQDQATGLILFINDDSRTIMSLKSICLDTNINFLFPNRNKEFYNLIDEQFVYSSNYTIRMNKLTELDSISESLLAKKELTFIKGNVLRILFNCANVLMDQSNFFINENISSIISNLDIDSKYLTEYSYVRKMSKEQCLKELQLKNETYITNCIKSQAAIDKFVEQCYFIENKNQADDLKKEITSYFFRIA
jgi:hypothetical protein